MIDTIKSVPQQQPSVPTKKSDISNCSADDTSCVNANSTPPPTAPEDHSQATQPPMEEAPAEQPKPEIEGQLKSPNLVQFGERYENYPFFPARGNRGDTFAIFTPVDGNATAIPIKSAGFKAWLTGHMLEHGNHSDINQHKVDSKIQQIEFYASVKGVKVEIFHRVGLSDNNIEIALGDDKDTRVRLTTAGVKKVESGSLTVFRRTPATLPLPKISKNADLKLLNKYLNVSDQDQLLVIAFITYTMCHPKIDGTKYLYLVINGDQGTGKSFLCRLIQRLVDPSALGLQAFPNNCRDLPIVLNNCHLAIFDNVRTFNAATSDLLCTASTGGNVSARALYSDDSLNIKPLHGAVVFNGIHSFVVQSDLAQRCMTIRTLSIDGKVRLSESKIMTEFEQDLPAIFAGLLDLCCQILHFKGTVQLTHPERMIEFCDWLARMESVRELTPGTLQKNFSDNMNQSQLNTLLDNPIGAAIYELISQSSLESWSGTPSELLNDLDECRPPRELYSRDWPRTPIALSKRIIGLKAAFETQGINIEFSRGKSRKINIDTIDGVFDSILYGSNNSEEGNDK